MSNLVDEKLTLALTDFYKLMGETALADAQHKVVVPIEADHEIWSHPLIEKVRVLITVQRLGVFGESSLDHPHPLYRNKLRSDLGFLACFLASILNSDYYYIPSKSLKIPELTGGGEDIVGLLADMYTIRALYVRK